jgi:hypothetical protein
MGSKQTILVACATLGPWSPSDGEPPPGKHPAMAVERRLRGDAQLVGGAGGQPTAGGSLSQQRAIQLALKHNPRIRAAGWDMQRVEARKQLAGLLPTPAVEIEVGNIGPTDGVSGFGAAETTLALAQEIELGVFRQPRSSYGPRGAEDCSPRHEPGVGDEGKETPDGVTEGVCGVERQLPSTRPRRSGYLPGSAAAPVSPGRRALVPLGQAEADLPPLGDGLPSHLGSKYAIVGRPAFLTFFSPSQACPQWTCEANRGWKNPRQKYRPTKANCKSIFP